VPKEEAMFFISHSTQDKKAAVDLQERLRDRGYACEQQFLDSDQRSGIKLGEKWEKVIYDNLRDCRALIVLCSPNWLQSKWCFAELTSAKKLIHWQQRGRVLASAGKRKVSPENINRDFGV
jgi:TIR domain